MYVLKLVPRYLRPETLLSCDAIMTRDVAEVKAFVTGIGIKSTMNPKPDLREKINLTPVVSTYPS